MSATLASKLSVSESNALSRLNTLVDNGMEFPDAHHAVVVQFNLSDRSTMRVQAAYDELQGAQS